ncbi:MAG: GerMN domain-containing protein [Actinomycetota bacterium]|nr:GerMN domain-containing protein [Actinomycetota bacterium]MDA2973483.1 GerMN domain-containing protein [Actinomycetota bacterium]MDA3009249.1 GerMN domain-containing protein [Actinomycetota bacterium]
MRRVDRFAPITVVAMALVTGCGIRPDAAPRDIPIEDRSLPASPISAAGASGGDARIYLLTPTEPRQVRSVTRSTGTRDDLLAALVAGPTDGELSLPLSSALPVDLEVLSTRSVGSVLYVDLSSAIAELSGSGLTLAVAQIVFTATDIAGVDAVQLTVDGQRFPWPRPDGATTTGLLRPYDFPGYAVSAQPDYPVLPARV